MLINSNNKKVLALITARGGSKGLVNKNIRLFNSIPLIAWTIKEAQKSDRIDRLVLSSDDDDIIKIAKEYSCETPFKRAAHLASDTATSDDVILDVLSRIEGFDALILLQPTSPLRIRADIDKCLELFEGSKPCEMAFSVCEDDRSPHSSLELTSDANIKMMFPKHLRKRRQDMPRSYHANGAVYVIDIEAFKKVGSLAQLRGQKAYVMPKDRSIDIDDMFDFKFAEVLASEKT